MEIAFGGRTHVGRRTNNEDAFFADAELGLFVVADGMGGYEGGEVASGLAIETIANFVGSSLRSAAANATLRWGESRSYEERLMDAALVAAHESILARRKGPAIEMGSTVVALLITGRELIVAHVGDSRLYRLREGELTALTRDHSAWEELKVGGRWSNEADFPYRNQITRALGVERAHRPDVARHELAVGDTYLLCTDGVYEPLEAGSLRAALELELDEGCARLISSALEMGGTDNLTGVMVRIVND